MRARVGSSRASFRKLLVLVAFVALAASLLLTPPSHTSAQNPASGTVSANAASPVTWDGTSLTAGAANTESTCVTGVNCDVYTLNVAGTKDDWAGKRVQVQLTWQTSANEYDIYIHQGSLSGPLVTSALAGPGLTNQTAYIDVSHWGTGAFVVHVAYDTAVAGAADEYHGAASAVAETPAPPPAAPQDTGPKLGFQNYEAPGVLTPVTQASSGAATVEYLGRNSGEPSVGANWNTGVVNYQSDLETLFVTFNDSCPANGQTATWVNRAAPTSQFIDSDPIGFTDRQTGRVFAGELTLVSPSCKTSFTDDDGKTWVATQGSGIASAVDHESIGGGPFHAPLARPTGVPGLYPNAVYYCSQDIAAAFCSRSDDGGVTFGPSVPMYSLLQCGGLHGHIKVAPDGTVYVPNNDCNGEGAVVVSEDNGTSWNVRPVRTATSDTTPGGVDPAVGIDNNGRVYFAIANASSSAAVATSDDQGRTWQNLYNVAASYGLKNVRYPAAVAGDAGRAAVAFYGSTTAGEGEGPEFPGTWHLYIASTFDGGQSWTTTDATPGYPVQRGGIWTQGGANISRNMLDFFDMTVDKQGRLIVGYVNGCAGGDCAQAAPDAVGNSYSATATIARQSSGRRLFAAYDPPNAMNAVSVPGVPFVTERRTGGVVHLSWSEADTGNSPIQSYQIMRGTASGAETLLATVNGAQTTYDDTAATDTTKTYYYKVVATNAVGSSCAAKEVAAPYVGDSCSGMIIHRNDAKHTEAYGGTAAAPPVPQMLIDYVAAGEPPDTNDLMFRMKVGDLSTPLPNSRWRVVWDSVASPGQQYYVGMTTDATGTPSFEYGYLADAGVPAVLVVTETRLGAAGAASNYQPDGTITIYVPKSAVGNPRPGDILGAINGRTFTGDTPATNTLERSTTFIDHTFVKGQTDNSYPAATYTVGGNLPCSAFVEQSVNSLVSLKVGNPGSAPGLSSFDLSIQNASAQTIYTPLRAEVAQLSSASGKVTVANADNSQAGAGALWDYGASVGSDSVLSPGELSAVRSLRFNNPTNEPFSVTFNVVGNLARTDASANTSSGASPTSGGTQQAGASSATTAATSTAGAAAGAVFKATYNPLLRSVTIQLVKP